MSASQTGRTSQQPANASDCSELTPEALAKCAQLLATDAMEWPRGLTLPQEEELTAAIRRIRHGRLVRFIAARIASDIADNRAS